MMYQHLDEKPPPTRHFGVALPQAVDAVLQKALAKSPDARYDSAGAFAADFKRALDGQSTVAGAALQPTPPSGASDPTPKRTPAQPSIEYPPPVFATSSYSTEHLLKQQTRLGVRWYSVGIGLALLIAVILGGGGLLVATLITSGDDERPSPTEATDPLNVPRIRIDAPLGNASTRVNEPITIRLTAFDNEGVTRIVLQHDDTTLYEQTVQPSSPLTLEFQQTFETAGTYHLELTAFREETAGRPRFLTIEVQAP